MSFNDFARVAGAIFTAIADSNNQNNCYGTGSYHNKWDRCISNRPIIYSPPVYVPPAPVYSSTSEGCYGNNRWDRPRRHRNIDNYSTCPRYIPNYSGNYPAPYNYPNSQTENCNTAYSNTTFASGNGTDRGSVEIGGRLISYNQADGTISDLIHSTGQTKVFGGNGYGNQGFNGFSAKEQQMLANGQAVRLPFGDNQAGTITFISSADKKRIDRMEISYNGQNVIVDNLSGARGGLIIPGGQNQYNTNENSIV